MDIEEKLEELETNLKSLALGLTHACLLIDQNMETTMAVMDALHAEPTESQVEDINQIFNTALKKVERLQEHFEGLQQQLADGTLEGV